MNLLRFSLLELLWMCGFCAVFLGLNLQVSPIEAPGAIPCASFCHATYTCDAGWPAPIVSAKHGCSWPSGQGFDSEKEKAIAGFKTILEMTANEDRPHILTLWKIGKINFLGILCNLIILASLNVICLTLWRSIKKKRVPLSSDSP